MKEAYEYGYEEMELLADEPEPFNRTKEFDKRCRHIAAKKKNKSRDMNTGLYNGDRKIRGSAKKELKKSWRNERISVIAAESDDVEYVTHISNRVYKNKNQKSISGIF